MFQVFRNHCLWFVVSFAEKQNKINRNASYGKQVCLYLSALSVTMLSHGDTLSFVLCSNPRNHCGMKFVGPHSPYFILFCVSAPSPSVSNKLIVNMLPALHSALCCLFCWGGGSPVLGPVVLVQNPFWMCVCIVDSSFLFFLLPFPRSMGLPLTNPCQPPPQSPKLRKPKKSSPLLQRQCKLLEYMILLRLSSSKRKVISKTSEG